MSGSADTLPDRAHEFHRLFLELRINDQLRYYNARCVEYRNAHRQVVILRNGLLAAATVAGGIGPFVPDGLRGALGLISAVLAALATAVTAFDALMCFPHLNKLYGDAASNLEEAAIDWRDADPATTELTAEVERVEDIFRSERGQWGQLLVTSAKPIPPQEPPQAQPEGR